MRPQTRTSRWRSATWTSSGRRTRPAPPPPPTRLRREEDPAGSLVVPSYRAPFRPSPSWQRQQRGGPWVEFIAGNALCDTDSEIARERAPIGVALLQERVAALDGLVSHVRQPRCLAREQLLTDEPVIEQVERELQHPLGLRRLAVDRRGPLQRDVLQLGVVDNLVDRAHLVHLLGGVRPAEEEDLTGELLADLPGQIRAAVAAVEAAHVGVGLLEPRMLAACEGEVADDVQAVPAAGGPAVDQADHHLRHETDQP